MSTSRQNGGVGVQAIPEGSRKIVLSLKEIVKNCSEAEIYAALKECNMDPNEAVNRLLTQDPFHEVKSKREKKKEGKDVTESRPRGGSNASNRGGRTRTGSDRYISRGSSTPHSSAESANFHGKSSSYTKENGSTPNASSLSSVPGTFGINKGRGPPGHSDSAYAENKGSSLGTADAIMPGPQPPYGYQSAWGGGQGQLSMADIVKMGRPHNKPVNGPNVSHHNVASENNSKSPEEYASKEHGPGNTSAQPQSTNDQWPSIEKPTSMKLSSFSGYNADSEQHLEESVGQPPDEVETRETESSNGEDSGENVFESDSISYGKIGEEGSRGVSALENNLYEDMSSYRPQGHDFEHHEGEDIDASVSSVTRNLQHLSVDKEEREFSSEDYAPAVIIPDHLQVQIADCSHLSFGSFGTGMSISYSSGTTTSIPVQSHLDETHGETDIPHKGHQETRGTEYYVDNSLANASDGSLFHRSDADAGSYDPSSPSQQEELKPDIVEQAHENQYPFPPGNQGYPFDDAQHLNSTFSHTSSHLQNIAPLSNVMQSYNTMQSSLSAAGVHPNREAELHYPPFPGTQSMPAKYANSVSTIDASTITMSEALKTAGLSSTQPAPQTITGTNVATGPPVPQHLAMHPYSQHTLPLGPFTNIMGYPFLPQSYTYLPSAFQQAFPSNSAYHHQSLAGLPQYKNSANSSSLPQSAAIASGYGAFGNASTISGNFQMNPPPAAPSGTTLNYDEILSSQYKENSHLLSLQQNENSAMWLQGQNSRAMSAIPASTYYNYPGQNQNPSGFRQGQQPSQNYGALGYANFYHSQNGLTLEQQQNNAREASLSGAQGQPKQQSQLWQNNY